LGLCFDLDDLLGVDERGEGEGNAEECELQWTKSGHKTLIGGESGMARILAFLDAKMLAGEDAHE